MLLAAEKKGTDYKKPDYKIFWWLPDGCESSEHISEEHISEAWLVTGDAGVGGLQNVQ